MTGVHEPIHTGTPQELPATLAGFAAAARRVLPAPAWSYYGGGAGAEVTLRDNEAAWARWALRPRVLVDVSHIEPAVTLLGRPAGSPLVVAPMAYQVGASPDGEGGMARAAAAVGAGFCLSTSASTTPAALAAAAPSARWWFRLYVQGGVPGALRQVAEAVDAGCEAVLLTVDLPVLGIRDQEREHPWDPDPGGTTLAVAAAGAGIPLAALTWRDLEAIVAACPVPLLAKGVLDPRDARRAVEAGCAGVVVSNHGGRQLDTVLPTAVALPDVVAEVGGEVDVLVDGGLRRGTDVVVALALGATAVLVGRPALWGLAVGGEAGARRVLELLQDEFTTALALLGLPRAADLRREHVTAAPWR